MTDEKLRLGGMALRNGLLVHGPTHWAAAVRREDGTIAVGSGRKPRLRVADGVAGVRGVLRLAEAVVVLPLVKKGLPEARLPWQDAKVIGAIVAASAGGQMDLRFSVLHWYEMTLSVGYAVGYQGSRRAGDEWMISLKIM